MLLFDPITGERKQITYKELEGITGLEKHKLQQRKSRGAIINCIKCFLVDDNTTPNQLKKIMAKYIPKDELWKDIKGFKGYKVSTYGRVKRGETFLLTYVAKRNRRVTLKRNKKSITLYVHSLVADAFLYQPKNTLVWHKDGNRYNCRADNITFMKKKTIAILSAKKGTKEVIKRDKDTNEEIERYKSINEAAARNYTTRINISRALHGEYKTALGYKWEFSGERISQFY